MFISIAIDQKSAHKTKHYGESLAIEWETDLAKNSTMTDQKGMCKIGNLYARCF